MIIRTNVTSGPQVAHQELLTGFQGDGPILVDGTNWNTFVAPTSSATGVVTGWMVAGLGDALQATAPLYLRVEMTTAGSGGLSWVVQVGTSYNGSLGGVITTQSFSTSATSSTSDDDYTVIARSYASIGRPDSLTLNYGAAASTSYPASHRLVLHFERLDAKTALLLLTRGYAETALLLDRAGTAEVLTRQQLNTTGYSLGLATGARTFEPTLYTRASGELVTPARNLVLIGGSDAAGGPVILNHPTARRFILPDPQIASTWARTNQVPLIALPEGQ